MQDAIIGYGATLATPCLFCQTPTAAAGNHKTSVEVLFEQLSA